MSGLRELDLEVAELVMELDRANARIDPMNRDSEPQYYMGYPHGHNFAPFYSTNIIAAFQVRQRMRELGFTFRLSDADNGQSAVSFFHEDAEQGLAGAAVAETDALAICLAALEAVKEKALAASG